MSPTWVSVGMVPSRVVTAVLAASMRGPGASVWFIDPDASSTIITGTDGARVGADSAAAGAPTGRTARTSAIVAAVTAPPPRAEPPRAEPPRAGRPRAR